MPQYSIQKRLMRAMLLTIGAVLLLTVASYSLYEFFSYRRTTSQQLRILSEIVASNSTAALAFDSHEEGQEILGALQAEENILAAILYDANGNVFARYPADAETIVVDDLNTKEVQFEHNRIRYAVPVMHQNKRLGTLYIVRGLSDILERLALYGFIVGGVILIGFAFAYFLIRNVQKEISTPIIALAAIAQRVSREHNYSVRATKQTNDELGILTEAFNQMLSQIEIQNNIIENARRAAMRNAQELEVKVAERTAEYKKQKEFAEVVINSSLVLIAVFDTEMRLLAFNEKCEEEFGFKKEDVIGRKFVDVFPSIKNSLTYNSILRAMGGETIHTPQYQSSVTGHYYESYICPLFNEKGEIYAVLMTAHNITQSVKSAEQIRQANLELERKNAELEQFAYIASHDLQEPLRKIKTFIGLIQKNSFNKESIEKYFAKVEHSADRMSSLIRAVLEYSRLEQSDETFEPTDLNVVLENVKSDFEILINQRNVQIASDQLPTVVGHRHQLQQLFSNLLSNAIKFSTVDPVISIRVNVVDNDKAFKHASAGKFFQVQFTDNGIGFEQQYADKIFTIFQRLNTRERFEGTGIGLAVCKKIVENHGGKISVNSEPGKGTTFNILLPVPVYIPELV